jgi:hypothetical protein
MENRHLREQQRDIFLRLRKGVNSQMDLTAMDAILAWQDAMGSKAGQSPRVGSLQDAFKVLHSEGIDLVGQCGWVFHHPTSPEGHFELLFFNSEAEVIEFTRRLQAGEPTDAMVLNRLRPGVGPVAVRGGAP